MPPRKSEKPLEEPVDVLKAFVLERKLNHKYTWEDLADKTHYPADTIRKNIRQKHSRDWNTDFCKAICHALGLSVKLAITLESGEVLQV